MTSCCADVRLTEVPTEVRRAQPLLGTLVEIAAAGPDRAALDRAIDAAFNAVATVHRLMSFQDPASELRRFNRGEAAAGLHPWTAAVLEAAADMRRRSGGVFDAACSGGGTDLSGIAKGFAVDRAIDVLKKTGALRGVVNAGGDLAVFGAASVDVAVRDPARPARLAAMVRLRDEAFASSGRVLDPATQRPSALSEGASVRAPTCMMADGLTKVVGVAGERARPLLRDCAATALLFQDGRMVTLED